MTDADKPSKIYPDMEAERQRAEQRQIELLRAIAAREAEPQDEVRSDDFRSVLSEAEEAKVFEKLDKLRELEELRKARGDKAD